MATSVMLRDAYHDAEVKNFNKGFETTFNIRLQQKQVRWYSETTTNESTIVLSQLVPEANMRVLLYRL